MRLIGFFVCALVASAGNAGVGDVRESAGGQFFLVVEDSRLTREAQPDAMGKEAADAMGKEVAKSVDPAPPQAPAAAPMPAEPAAMKNAAIAAKPDVSAPAHQAAAQAEQEVARAAAKVVLVEPAPVPKKKIWLLEPGWPLHVQLINWAYSEGWVLNWNPEGTRQVPAKYSSDKPLLEAIKEVLSTGSVTIKGRPLKAVAWKNKVIDIDYRNSPTEPSLLEVDAPKLAGDEMPMNGSYKYRAESSQIGGGWVVSKPVEMPAISASSQKDEKSKEGQKNAE